uniref:30S ribosomal protein S20 n=1 Tax=Cutleria multifida TaxID=74475 RepID=UPI002E7826EF|nr:30S ribosomal protein S20 [Cutleria multifida]WAM62660.1 30S ribosomal protein S20 [Cutleria multifida]
MANNKSAKKRIKINKRNNIQNNSYKSLMKTSKKNHLLLLKESRPNDTSNSNSIQKSFKLAISKIDRAVKKKIIHKNTAARKKANLYKQTFLFK